MAKVQIKSEKITPFGGIFHVRELFSRFVGPVIDKVLGLRCTSYGYQYSEMVETVEKHWEHFYIRANRCGSLYDSLLALLGWQCEEINGIEYELNSIIVEKWEGKAYRLVIQRERRMNGDLDLWEGEYTYRCILTNDYTSTNREIVEFYNLRGGKERIFDDMNSGFGWARLPKSFMAENAVFLLLTALIRRSALPLAIARTSTSSSWAGWTRKPSD